MSLWTIVVDGFIDNLLKDDVYFRSKVSVGHFMNCASIMKGGYFDWCVQGDYSLLIFMLHYEELNVTSYGDVGKMRIHWVHCFLRVFSRCLYRPTPTGVMLCMRI